MLARITSLNEVGGGRATPFRRTRGRGLGASRLANQFNQHLNLPHVLWSIDLPQIDRGNTNVSQPDRIRAQHLKENFLESNLIVRLQNSPSR